MIKPTLFAGLMLASPLAAQEGIAPHGNHPAAATISDRDLALVRRVTARFADADSAAAAGFAPIAARCIEDATHGGMGYHAINREYLTGPLTPERPAYLVFEKVADGKMVLTAVEYAVPFSRWSADSVPPTLFGQSFAPHAGLKIWFLHVWAFHDNPSGVFADYSARVVCRP